MTAPDSFSQIVSMRRDTLDTFHRRQEEERAALAPLGDRALERLAAGDAAAAVRLFGVAAKLGPKRALEVTL